MKYIIICKGSYDPRKINMIVNSIQQAMKNYGSCLNVLISKHKGDNVENARVWSREADMIISVGGDGTFYEVVKGLLSGGNENAYLLHIPAGTANDIGINLNYSNHPTKYIEQAINNPVDYDIFSINSNIFTFAAAGGYLTNVAYAPSPESKRIFGKAAYIHSILTEITKKRYVRDISFNVDGKEYDGEYLAMVITNSHTVGSFHIYDNISLNDGVCELMMIKNDTNNNIISQGVKVLSRRMKLPDMSCVEIYRGEKITFQLNNPFPNSFVLDGERSDIYGKDDLEVKRNRQIKVLKPSLR